MHHFTHDNINDVFTNAPIHPAILCELERLSVKKGVNIHDKQQMLFSCAYDAQPTLVTDGVFQRIKVGDTYLCATTVFSRVSINNQHICMLPPPFLPSSARNYDNMIAHLHTTSPRALERAVWDAIMQHGAHQDHIHCLIHMILPFCDDEFLHLLDDLHYQAPSQYVLPNEEQKSHIHNIMKSIPLSKAQQQQLQHDHRAYFEATSYNVDGLYM